MSDVERYRREVSALLGREIGIRTAGALMLCCYSVSAAVRELRKGSK